MVEVFALDDDVETGLLREAAGFGERGRTAHVLGEVLPEFAVELGIGPGAVELGA